MADPAPEAAVGGGPRRDFVWQLAKGAGLSPFLLGILDGSARAVQPGPETDMAILFGAIALEHQAIALYDAGLERKWFSTAFEPFAVEFRGDHLGHRDTQVTIAEERGGEPPKPLAHYEFTGAAMGTAMVRAALEIEIAAQMAYTALISNIRTKDYLLSAAFILVDEVRHMTVWRRALGYKIY